MKKFKVALLLFFIQVGLFSESPKPLNYYPYTKKKVELRTLNFRRYIIPQLQNMTDNFYQLVSSSGLENNSLKSLRQALLRFSKLFETSKEVCKSNDSTSCHAQFESMYFESKTLLKYIKTFQQEVSKHQKSSLFFHHEISFALIDQIETKVSHLSQTLRRYSLDVEKYQKHQHNLSSIEDSLSEVKLLFYRLPFLVVPPPLKSILYDVWALFFRNVENLKPNSKEKDLFLRRLEELNLAWNSFHMKVTKGPYSIDKKVQSTVKSMHVRWNLVLKVILK